MPRGKKVQIQTQSKIIKYPKLNFAGLIFLAHRERRGRAKNQREEADPLHHSGTKLESHLGSNHGRLGLVLQFQFLTEKNYSRKTLLSLKVSQSPRTHPTPIPTHEAFLIVRSSNAGTEKIKGRDPDRWRRDPLGNIVFRKLVGCSGCLCHDYDHILPYSKGGQSTLENCQVLQAKVNRSKGNRTEFSRADLIQRSSYCRVSGRDVDLLELSTYGNVRLGQDYGGCRIQ